MAKSAANSMALNSSHTDMSAHTVGLERQLKLLRMSQLYTALIHRFWLKDRVLARKVESSDR